MKGLIRNDFYNVEGSMKLTMLAFIIIMIVLGIAGIYFPPNSYLASAVIGGTLGAFGALSGTAMQKDGASKWSRFELTMPISRSDVMKARYISFILYILIGLVMAIISALIFYALTGFIDAERAGYGFTFGISFAFSIPTFMTPLVLIFGTDKNDVLLMISMALGLGLFFVSSVVSSLFLSNFANAELVFRLIYLVFSIVLFAASFMLSTFIYKRKEL